MKVYHGSTQAVEYPLRFEQPNNQLCILNQRLIDECLSFKEYVTIK